MYWIFLVVAVVVVLYFRQPKTQWPDGPRGLPLIGIIPDKNVKLYQQFANLVPRYGDFFSSMLGRTKIIVLSSPSAVNELIVKRGGKYSSRPKGSPQAQLVGASRLVTMQYGNEFRVRTSFIMLCTNAETLLTTSFTSRNTASSFTVFSVCKILVPFYHIKNTNHGRRSGIFFSNLTCS